MSASHKGAAITRLNRKDESLNSKAAMNLVEERVGIEPSPTSTICLLVPAAKTISVSSGLRPEAVAQIEFLEGTAADRLRHSNSSDCVRTKTLAAWSRDIKTKS